MSGMIWGVLATLLSTAILAFCGYIAKEIKTNKKYRDQHEEEELIKIIDKRLDCKLEPINASIAALQNVDNRIDEKLKPIHVEIKELADEIKATMTSEEQLRIQLTGSYRFRLMQLCRHYLAQGYMTEEQMDQLSEFYRIYEALGGNGQAKEYYDRTKKLPIVTTLDHSVEQ